MARFYQWDLADIKNMNMDEFNSYHEAMTRIEAREHLVSLNLADYPNMKSEDRRKLFKSISDKAYPPKPEDFKSTEDLARFLNG